MARAASPTTTPAALPSSTSTSTTCGAALSVVPVEQFAGVPDYYLLHVVNVNDFAVLGAQDGPETGQLSADCLFHVTIDGVDQGTVGLQQSATSSNTSLDQLISQLNG